MAGVSSLMTGLNIASEAVEKRSFVFQQIVALAMTVGAAFLAIIALAAVALIPATLGFLPLTDSAKAFLGLGRWPLLAILVWFGLAVAYRLGPSTEHASWKWITWALQSRRVFGWRVPASFPPMSPTSVRTTRRMGRWAAPVTILLSWFWLSAMVVLVGAAIDAEAGTGPPARARGHLPTDAL